ncbi:hypothetical protein [Limosilactobacillus gastricus]|uniref:hypothetical protein n=1 Tax=Limosilactobacillus gastricus TaxID=227942 RepID=UPI0002FF332B|nr:hypothetical protein [Limosilactobacillus gastricus]
MTQKGFSTTSKEGQINYGNDQMALKGTFNGRRFVVIRRRISLNANHYEGYVEVKKDATISKSVKDSISVYGGVDHHGPIQFNGRLFDDRQYLGFSLTTDGISEIGNYSLAVSEVKRMAKQVDGLAKKGVIE